ncbi:alpha beta fold family protein [Cystoisospora suis]|uniref:Alpha beta fold family protein n=1 Tax=Cystoisospora suis TaxID=483139 RepID=A0A2C6L1A9_9APIC|nr:alpha beta fold family protein [Cystoisospora suis]
MQQLKNPGQAVFPPVGKNTFFSSQTSLGATQTRQDMSFYPTIVVREPSSFTHTPLAEAAEHGPPLWLTLLPHKCVRGSFTSFHEDDLFSTFSDFETADSYQPTTYGSSWPKQGTPQRIHPDGKRSTLFEFFGSHYNTGFSSPPTKERDSKRSGRPLSNLRKAASIGVSPFDGLRSRWPAESHRSDQISSTYFLQESFVSWTGSTAPLSCLAGRNRVIDAFLDSIHVEELSIELLGRQDGAVSSQRRPPPSTTPSCFSLQVQQAHEKTQPLSKQSTGGVTDKGKQLKADVSLPPCIPPGQSLRQAFLLLRQATVQPRGRKTVTTTSEVSDPDLTLGTKSANPNAHQISCQWDNDGVRRSSLHRGDAKTVQVVTGRNVKAGQPHDSAPASDKLELNEKHSGGFPTRGERLSDEGVHWPKCGDTRKPVLREQQFQTKDPPPMSASTGNFSCRPTDADYESLFYIKIGHGPERVVVIHGICMSGSFFSDILACFGGTLEELKQTGQSGETQTKPCSSSLPGCESDSSSSAAATSLSGHHHHHEGLKRRPNKPKSTGDGMRDFSRDVSATKRNHEWKDDTPDSHNHQGDGDSGGSSKRGRPGGVHHGPATITTASSAKLDSSLFTFYIVDLLGFGRSTTIYSETEYSRKEQAQRVIQDVICNEKLSAVHLVGHSFGSLVAAEVAAMLPTGAVKSVLLLSPAYFESTRQAMQSLSSALFPASHSAAHPILAFFILKFGRMLKPVLEPLFSFFVPKDELSSLSVADLFRIDPDAMVGTIRSIVHERLEDSLQTMQDRRIRVTLVHGTGDGVIPIRQAQVMAERYSNVHLRPVKGFVHHFPSSHSKFTAHLIYQEVLRHREATSTRTNMRVQSVASGLGRAAHPADALACRTALSTGLDCSEFL